MRILVFSWRDPKHPLAGGAEQVMHEHMKGWVRGGHSVTLFVSRFKGSSKEETLNGVRIIRSGHQYHLGVQLTGILYYLKHKNDYDFVVDQFHGMPFFTPIYVKKPILAVIQETAREVWFLNPLPRPLNWIYGVAGYFLEPLVFLLYKKVPFMTGSQSAKEDLIKFGTPESNIHIVPHGVIVKNPRPLPQKEKIPTIVYLGVLSKDKGIEDALRCFSLLTSRERFRFWIIGRAETENYSSRVKKLAGKLGLLKTIRFWGFVLQSKKFELLARAHILVNPSVREGWGLVNIEANSVGVPVVAYKNAGLVDSVKDGKSGILCKENTPEGLAKNTLTLIRSKDAYKNFVKGALEWSKKFSWKKSRKLSLNLIRCIVSEQG